MPKKYYYIVTEGLQKEKYQRELINNFQKSIETYELQIENYQKSVKNKESLILISNNYNNFLTNKIKQDSTYFVNKIDGDSKTIKRFKSALFIESIILVFIIIFK